MSTQSSSLAYSSPDNIGIHNSSLDISSLDNRSPVTVVPTKVVYVTVVQTTLVQMTVVQTILVQMTVVQTTELQTTVVMTSVFEMSIKSQNGSVWSSNLLKTIEDFLDAVVLVSTKNVFIHFFNSLFKGVFIKICLFVSVWDWDIK